MKADKKTIDDIFERGVGEFIDPNNTFREKLENNPQDIIIKFGIDPTRPDIHLGHAVVLKKLRKLQDLGCKIVFLVGDFTANIGDPSGKSNIRPKIEQKEIEENLETYVNQVGKILSSDPSVFSWIRNSDWFYSVSDLVVEKGEGQLTGKDKDGNDSSVQIPSNSHVGKAALYQETRMQKTHLKNDEIHDITLRGLLWTLQHITHARLIERDMFQERIKNGGELYMHEMLYPVLQGIDSLMLGKIYGSCDLEIGGTDQTFNMLMGRDVMKANSQPQQAVLSLKILEGTDGKEKMSKSLDNYIGITDTPSDMYGKVMSVPDSSLVKYFELCTYTPMSDIEAIKKDLESKKKNPRDIKMELARQIVAMYHSEAKATKAEEDFIGTFQKSGVPEDIQERTAGSNELLQDILLDGGFIASKNEFKRLVKEGAIKKEDGEKVTDEEYIAEEGIYKIGKKRFLRVVIKEPRGKPSGI